jgi:hypothetical protein
MGREPIMFSKDDIGRCGCNNSDDLEMQMDGLKECLNCWQENCPAYQMLEKWRKLHEEKVGENPKTVLLCDDPMCFAGWVAEHLLEDTKKKQGGEKDEK